MPAFDLLPRLDCITSAAIKITTGIASLNRTSCHIENESPVIREGQLLKRACINTQRPILFVRQYNSVNKNERPITVMEKDPR